MTLFLKHKPREIYGLYTDSMARGYDAKHRRLVFHGCIGDKYNKIYFDVRHIDDNHLLELVDMSSFEKFYVSIHEKVFPVVKGFIEKNVQDTKKVYAENANDELLFIRSIKHVMSDIELKDLAKMRPIIKERFPNSSLVVVSDVKENAERDSGISYLQFNHWKPNKEDKVNFLNLLP